MLCWICCHRRIRRRHRIRRIKQRPPSPTAALVQPSLPRVSKYVQHSLVTQHLYTSTPQCNPLFTAQHHIAVGSKQLSLSDAFDISYYIHFPNLTQFISVYNVNTDGQPSNTFTVCQVNGNDLSPAVVLELESSSSTSVAASAQSAPPGSFRSGFAEFYETNVIGNTPIQRSDIKSKPPTSTGYHLTDLLIGWLTNTPPSSRPPPFRQATGKKVVTAAISTVAAAW